MRLAADFRPIRSPPGHMAQVRGSRFIPPPTKMCSPPDDHLAVLFPFFASLCNIRVRRDTWTGGLIDTSRECSLSCSSSFSRVLSCAHTHILILLLSLPTSCLPQRSRDEHRNHHQHHDHDHAFPFPIHCMIAFISFHFPDSLRFLLLSSFSAVSVSFLKA